MFARKGKASDVSASLQRFLDLSREPSSRAKHFRIVFDALTDDVRSLTSLSSTI